MINHKEEEMVSDVFMICNAYESGVGKGFNNPKGTEGKEHKNPYKSNCSEYEAWTLGIKQGIKLYWESKNESEKS